MMFRCSDFLLADMEPSLLSGRQASSPLTWMLGSVMTMVSVCLEEAVILPRAGKKTISEQFEVVPSISWAHQVLRIAGFEIVARLL